MTKLLLCLRYAFGAKAVKIGSLLLALWIPHGLLAEQNPTEEATRFDTRQFADWSVGTVDLPMNDGSLLREYLASSEEVDNVPATGISSTSRFEFVFHPRFLCSPLIRVVRSYSELSAADRLSNNNETAAVISLEIDSEPVEYPALVERLGQTRHYFYNVNLQRRATLRVLVELGVQLSIVYEDGATASLSLKGSQKSLEIASTNCLKH